MGFFKNLFSKAGDNLYAPMTGEAVAITEVPDPTFAECMLGNGIAINPTEGKVYAPCDATVDMMFETGHAVSLIADYPSKMRVDDIAKKTRNEITPVTFDEEGRLTPV